MKGEKFKIHKIHLLQYLRYYLQPVSIFSVKTLVQRRVCNWPRMQYFPVTPVIEGFLRSWHFNNAPFEALSIIKGRINPGNIARYTRGNGQTRWSALFYSPTTPPSSPPRSTPVIRSLIIILLFPLFQVSNLPLTVIPSKGNRFYAVSRWTVNESVTINGNSFLARSLSPTRTTTTTTTFDLDENLTLANPALKDTIY